MESLVHYLLEDCPIKYNRFGHSLFIKAEFRSKNEPGKEYTVEGLVSNNEFAINSFRFYDAKTGIKLGEIQKDEKISNFT